jgi:hypothetical protein
VLESGARIGFDAEIQLGHRNLTHLQPYLRRQCARGQGVM